MYIHNKKGIDGKEEQFAKFKLILREKDSETQLLAK